MVYEFVILISSNLNHLTLNCVSLTLKPNSMLVDSISMRFHDLTQIKY